MRIRVIKAGAAQPADKLKVCAYARVSTDSPEQEGSLENQEQHYREMISANPMYEFAGIYSDQGISGYKESRPGFQRMMEDARAGKIDLIITKSISRFARNTVTVLKSARELKGMGVGIFFELQNINTLSGEGELMLTILSAFAQAESEGASENTKLTNRRKFEQGIPAVRVGKCYGFSEDADGEVILDAEQAFVVRKMYELAAQGVWVSRIRGYLNKRGYRKAGGQKWDDCGVARILQSEIYKGGVMMQRTYLDADRVRHKNKGQRDRWYIAGHHPAIVSEEVWDRVQEVLAERSEYLKSDKPERDIGKGNSHNSYPLTGRLHCPKCGAVLHHIISNGGRQEYWVCSTRLKRPEEGCPGIWVPATAAEGWQAEGKAVVMEHTDEFGVKSYSFMEKKAYERRKDCPYKPKPEKKGPSSHSTYPLSGRLYCAECGSLMHHQWAWNGKEFWWCGKRVKQGPDACRGVRVPAEVADTWEFEGEIIVSEGENGNGERCYTYTSKPASGDTGRQDTGEGGIAGGGILPGVHQQ